MNIKLWVDDYVRVSEGCRIPRFWGLAYFSLEMRRSLFLPIPLNLMFRFGQIVWQNLVMTFYPTLFERLLIDAEQRGADATYRRGFDEGRTNGLNEGVKEGFRIQAEHMEKVLDTILPGSKTL